MMKDRSGGCQCFSLLYKLGLNPDQKRVKDPMMKDDTQWCMRVLCCIASGPDKLGPIVCNDL
jgi:hypothetical protein